ncbi:type II secretion system F family protein [bacterium]|nr:type II secretion system F family protein [bacterium]
MDPLIPIAFLSLLTVLVLIYGLAQFALRRRAALADRVQTYAGIEEQAAIAADEETRELSPAARLLNLVFGRGYVRRVEQELAHADVPMRPAEYILARLVLAGVGLLVGLYFFGYLHSGLLLATVGYFVPALFVRLHQNKRRAKFVRQLADALMLLTNSLRSGYSFLKGLELVAKEMDDPISKELHRTLREINLGATVDDALLHLGRRVDSRDLDIVISAFLVQKEVGGNLTEIMQKVAETIRERLRIQGDIKVLTAQGRFSGLVVGLLPLFVFLVILMSSPEYFKVLFGPPTYTLIGGNAVPIGVLLLAGALGWQMIGGYLIYKIISIKV